MSRYTGPKVRVMRALGVNLPGLSSKTLERRPYPPGDHGGSRRRQDSVYKIQLREKQKLKMNYGLTERQMRRVIKAARRSKTSTGTRLLELLESRLDNVVFRAGFARSIPAARQLVNHGHFTVNGRKLDIPSAVVKSGDVVKIKEKSANLAVVKSSLENPPLTVPEWLTVESGEKTVTLNAAPSAESVPFPVDVQQVIEYYTRRI